MARIHISDLHLSTVIGIFDWERKHKQGIIVNITLDYDASQASRSDNIADAVDYNELTNRITKFVEESEYNLLEKLVEEILNITLENPLIERSTVKVDKPQALQLADSVSVEISRGGNKA